MGHEDRSNRHDDTLSFLKRRMGKLILIMPFILILGGCSQPPERIFDVDGPSIGWPPPPSKARIQYIGEIQSSADLKPGRSMFQGISDFLFGAEEPSKLYGPRAVLCTRDGRYLWVADPGGRCLHLFDLEDRSYKKINRVGDSFLLSPVGLCPGPGDSIYVCDSESIEIHRLSATDGELLETLKLLEDILRPAALSYNHEARELHVVDVSAHNIKVLGLDGDIIRVIGNRGNDDGEFNFPCDIIDDGRMLWIADAGNHRVQGLTRAGKPAVSFGRAGDAPGDLALPKGIAVDSEGHVYVIDARFENIQIFGRTGQLLLAFGSEGTGPGEFWLPSGICIGTDDRIWVCDSYNGRVQVFEYIKEVEDATVWQ
jgi:sugar lactone lactonase YvrE